MSDILDNFDPWMGENKQKTHLCVVCAKEKSEDEVGKTLSSVSEFCKALHVIFKRRGNFKLMICKVCKVKLLDTGCFDDFFDRL